MIKTHTRTKVMSNVNERLTNLLHYKDQKAKHIAKYKQLRMRSSMLQPSRSSFFNSASRTANFCFMKLTGRGSSAETCCNTSGAT